MKLVDIAGRRFHRLTAVRHVDTISNAHRWECLCDCGKTTVVRKGNLVSGAVKSCGCLNDEKRNAPKKHGHLVQSSETRSTYTIWYMMIARCTKKNHPLYPEYGARGITVCAEWRNDFETFLSDMGVRPNGLTLDRKNKNRRPWGTVSGRRSGASR
jgi:hypothetical protein